MPSRALRAVYWISTILLCLLMTMSAGMYLRSLIFGEGAIAGVFERLGYPGYLPLPLAIAKLLGIAAILTKRFRRLTEWAYAGFFFDLVLAVSAHIAVGDGGYVLSGTGLVLWLISYALHDKARPQRTERS
ncbi:MAG: DoxX family protein [Myxococcota bacterium]